MLAVQQQQLPRMGSSQSDDDAFLPFGYSMGANQDGLFDAPDPAGAPLLSETDSKFLSSFFQDMTSDQYTMPSFGEGLNFSDAWFDLPPQFMGTSTSFGQQGNDSGLARQDSHAGFLPDTIDMSSVLSGNHMMQPPPPPPPPPSQPQQQQHHLQQQHQQQLQQQHQQHHYPHEQPQGPQNPHVFQNNHHSDDVLNAAATLLQNGSASSPRSASSKGKEPSSSRKGPPIGHLRHQALEEFKQESRKDLDTDDHDHDHTFTQWMFGSKEKSPTPRTAQIAGLNWGSDANFGPVQGYVPAPNKETAATHHQVQMKCLECLEPSKSGANTRSGSPSQEAARQEQLRTAQDADAPPRKRRKSKIQKAGTVDEEEDDSSTPGSVTKRKNSKSAARSNNGLPSPSSDTSGKRRKSAAAKPARENLTEEQKRENHIRSEQKRRTLIKEGFDDLCDLVPGLKNCGNISKSTMLTMAAEWLEELLKGNEILSKQLSSLGQQ